MRVLIVGATGLIGSALAARLAVHGHQVVGVGRRFEAGSDDISQLRLDLAEATTPEAWTRYLAGVDAVVNCAGVLQDGPGVSTATIHVKSISALFQACERTGTRRVVHVSAVGVDAKTPSAFSRTKLAGDKALTRIFLGLGPPFSIARRTRLETLWRHSFSN